MTVGLIGSYRSYCDLFYYRLKGSCSIRSGLWSFVFISSEGRGLISLWAWIHEKANLLCDMGMNLYVSLAAGITELDHWENMHDLQSEASEAPAISKYGAFGLPRA